MKENPLIVERGGPDFQSVPRYVDPKAVADDDLSDSWRAFNDSLAQRPAGRWVADIYRRHRGRSAEVPSDAAAMLGSD